MVRWLLSIVVLMTLCLSNLSSAEAGDKSHYRWQGIAIGAASALFLGHMASHDHVSLRAGYAPRPAVTSYRYSPRHRYGSSYAYYDGPGKRHKSRARHSRGYGRHVGHHDRHGCDCRCR